MLKDTPLDMFSFAALTLDQLAEVVEIYRDAFAAPWEWPAERIADLAEEAAASASWCALALVDGAEAIGFAVAGYLPTEALAHLHYLAIARTRRGAGVGATLLNAVRAAGEDWAQAAGWSGCRGALIEVERPEDSLTAVERELRLRRIAFYLRNGAVPAGMLFDRPDWAPPEMPNWDIMILPGQAWAGSLAEASRQALASMVLAEIRANLGPDLPLARTESETHLG
jgi:GNAT superfamily N-acetyltransferase